MEKKKEATVRVSIDWLDEDLSGGWILTRLACGKDNGF